MLYRKNGDILKTLSKALGKAQQSRKNESVMRKEYSSLVKSENAEEPSDDNILQACTALNLRSNQQIKALIQTYQKHPLLCAAFIPENLIE